MDAKAYVYAILVDGVIRYIGKGTNDRIRKHFTEARSIIRRRGNGEIIKTSKFYNSLASAIVKGNVITSRILHSSITDNKAFELEKLEIAAVTKGQLWNLLSGGEGGDPKVSKEIWDRPGMRYNSSIKRKLMWKDPEFRAHMTKSLKDMGESVEFKEMRRNFMLAFFSNEDNKVNFSKTTSMRWDKDRKLMEENIKRGRNKAKEEGVFKLCQQKLREDVVFREKHKEAQRKRRIREAQEKALANPCWTALSFGS